VTIVLILLGLLFALVGIAGSILPIIPGPPLSFLALLILSLAKNWEPFSSTFLIIMGCLMILLIILDYVLPAGAAKRYGASKLGVWGSIIGMFVGLFVFPPWGAFIGAIGGAITGELVAGKERKNALRAGWGAFLGNMAIIALKLAFSGAILFFYVKGIF
jgi:uncharacterized protein YqgC (DUF456 family)